MITILFVDDESNILEGLQRMLRSMRQEWHMCFAHSGVEALTILAAQSIDVIVSDIRMPGMDGAQLLHEVKQQYPHIVRIILSGYAEKALIMKSVGAAHQYLAKPCDAETLKSTVSLACALRNLLADEKLRRLVSQLHTVPSLPTLYSELLGELNAANSSLKKIGAIIKQDIGMTVKILQMVNSAFFGLRRQLSDVTEAVNLLGLDTITALALAMGVFTQFEGQPAARHAIAELWQHSSTVGAIAKQIATKEASAVTQDAFTAGLLHDIGEVVLAANLPQQFAAAQELVARENKSKLEAEKQIFDATHPEVGAYLLGLWGLPNPVVEAVAFHHTPSASLTDSFTALTAVHVADGLSHERANSSALLQQPYDVKYLTKLGLLEKLPIWQTSCVPFQENAATHL
jgi:HD-like signal output (HDOD) protein